MFILCQKSLHHVLNTFPFLYVDFFFHFSFLSCPLAHALRVISCEVSGVCSTDLPSRLWIQTVVFGNAPSVITSCGAQQVPQQKDGRRPRLRYRSQWLQYQNKRMAQVQEQEVRACQGRKEGWKSVSSPEPLSPIDLSPCP